ncbi:peptide chain release factor N(5)-glutamine methyltransferase [Magnetococcales bacterium HHB-1]
MSRQIWTIRSLRQWSIQWLGQRGIENPGLDAELLMAHALDIKRIELFLDMDRPLLASELSRYKQLIKRRAAFEPIAYILGEREFWSLSFSIKPGMLIPRPDSERLIEAICELIPDKEKKQTFLDLGTGPGTLLLSLLSEYPKAQGVGIDICEENLACCQKNSEKLKLSSRTTLLKGNWWQPLTPEYPKNHFDVILSNPPYISKMAWKKLAPDIAEWEPKRALWGGDDGLIHYPVIINQATEWLKPDGILVVEIGENQEQPVSEYFKQAQFDQVTCWHDYANLPRCITGIKPTSEATSSQ